MPGTPFANFIRFNAERGEYGPGDVEEIVREHVERAKRREPHHFERTCPDGSVIEVRGTPLPGRGFVATYTYITDWKMGEDISHYFDFLASLSIESPVFTRDVRTRRVDGTIGWQTWTSSAFFDGEGNVLYFRGVGVDITERKKTEEALRESEREVRTTHLW